MHKPTYFIILIYILFSSEGFCQNLHLTIHGKTETETAIIDSLNYSKNHKDYQSLTSEIDNFQNSLLNLGYIENQLVGVEKINDSTFRSEIHLKTKFDTIYIYYKNEQVEKSTLKRISKEVTEDYFVLNIAALESKLNFINSEFSKKGFPFSKLTLTNIRKQSKNTLKADLTLESSNQKRIINDIVIKGYEKFPKSYLKHYLKIKPNQVFDLQTIQKKTSQLNSLPFANETKTPEVLFSQDSTTLYLYLEKTKSNTFDGFLGFGTNEDTNKLEFDGYLNLNLINNLNFGEAFKVLYKSDENDQKTFEADLSLPYLFKSPIGVDFMLRIFKKDSSFTTANQSVKLHYQINAKHKVYTGITSTESNNLLSSNPTGLLSDYETFNYNVAYQFLSAHTLNRLFPLNSKLYTEAGFGNRTTTNSEEKQSNFVLDAFKIFNLNEKNSIYLRTNGATLISDTYFENELLRFGGINSIRGFEENSIYATLYGLINTEYRYQINNSIYINSIIDAAYFENQIANTDQKLFGYGFGFGLLTKAGLFKLNYANGKNEDSNFKFSNSKLHLSLIANF
ncbi:POTRA domain-containing protein [Tamlana sp. 1_MG-2023]|uniref:POTRA domain-containing protein n=1 Tax=Tamlana sp. 1_MG-2023 TaxID=3062628 RepID=UPI0026E22685|nr:POTRA domain-containing protein [Tamlana sp. 1_MG-2023]MDO6791117.1 POTRA domain-containing protein [Tamlana sp. 1_MG-2023]